MSDTRLEKVSIASLVGALFFIAGGLLYVLLALVSPDLPSGLKFASLSGGSFALLGVSLSWLFPKAMSVILCMLTLGMVDI